MPFVKVDTAILDSSVWMPRDLRSLFLTALFMAKPYELKHPTAQLKVRTLEETGWEVPAGEYGLIEAAATRIIERDGMELEQGYRVLEALGERDNDSKNPDYDGRRVVRVRGGYIVLNFRLYRDKDYTAAQRQQRHRDKKRKALGDLPGITPESRSNGVTVTPVTPADANDPTTHASGCRCEICEADGGKRRRGGHAVTSRQVTQAEAEAEGEAVTTSSFVEGASPPPVSHIPTEISTEPGVRLVRMLNRGMQDNPAIGTAYNPVLATSGHTLEAVEKLRAAGIPLEFAEGWIYTLACGYKPRKLGDQIQSLTYLIPAVAKEWEGTVARVDAAAASKPAGAPTAPSPGQNTSNGTGPAKATRSGGNRTGDLKGEGIIVYGRIRDGIRTEIVNNPHDSGNHLEVIISPAVDAELSSPARTALAAIGGPSAINRSTDESLSWKFAAAYAAAVAGQ